MGGAAGSSGSVFNVHCLIALRYNLVKNGGGGPHMSKQNNGLLRRPQDIVFVGLLVLSLVISMAAVRSQLEQRSLSSASIGGRKVDIDTIRRQTTEGHLSPHKAQYYKKIPRR
jgi:hypothetical protein